MPMPMLGLQRSPSADSRRPRARPSRGAAPCRRLLAAAAALLALAGPATAQANLLVNGSFERGAFAPNAKGYQQIGIVGSPIEGWSTFVGDIFWIGPANEEGVFASDGRLSLSLYDPTRPLVRVGSVHQTVATQIGARYRLSFDLGSSDGFGRPVAIRASAGGQTGLFANQPGASGMQWDAWAMDFTAVEDQTVIAFVGAAGDGYIGLDNAALRLLAPVPEPGAALLMVAGLALVAGLARQRRPGGATACAARSALGEVRG